MLGRYRRGADANGVLCCRDRDLRMWDPNSGPIGRVPPHVTPRPASTAIAMRPKHDQFPISQLHSFYNLLTPTDSLT